MGGPRAAPGYGRRARGDPDASGSIRGCTPPAAATQIRNKTKVGNLIRVAQFPSGAEGDNAYRNSAAIILGIRNPFLLRTYFRVKLGIRAKRNWHEFVTEVVPLWLLL